LPGNLWDDLFRNQVMKKTSGRKSIHNQLRVIILVVSLLAAMISGLGIILLVSVAVGPVSWGRLLLYLIAGALVATLFGYLFGVKFIKGIEAPLEQLIIAAQKVHQGELNQELIIPEAPDELAIIGSGLEKGRQLAQAAMVDLEQSEQWYNDLIQTIREGIVIFNKHGLIASFSPGAERITGWQLREVTGKHLDQVFRVPKGERPLASNLPPIGHTRQINFYHRNGKQITLAVTAMHKNIIDGEKGKTALVLSEITEEEAAQRLRSYFLANITHEFRTPLASLNASVEFLLEEIDRLSQSEIGELLKSIHLSVTGLQTLIDNLLESISIEAGRFSIRKKPTDLNKILADARQLMKPLLNRRQQELTVEQPDVLPLVVGDAARLTQVLVNLISNASKYGPMGQTIDVKMGRYGDQMVRVAVMDRGPGIPLTEQANLFRRFLRAGAQDGSQYGIGLGLSVVRVIVEEHGGEVGVDERPGGGSIFWFSVPIVREEA